MRIRLVLITIWLVAALQMVSAQKSEVYFSDTFASTDGQRPRGWKFTTTDGLFWQVRDGWLATGNGDDLISPEGYSFGVIDAPGAANWTDYRISCRFYMKQTNGQVLLVGRWADSQNYYRAAIEVYDGRRLLRLSRVQRGRATELGTQVVDLDKLGIKNLEQGAPDSAVEFFLAMSANRITAGISDKVLVEARDTALGAGTAGVGERYNEVYFDDILVSADPAKSVAIRNVYHVEVARNVPLSAAADIQKQLSDKGMEPVFVRGAGDRVSVQQGNYLTEQQATQALERVKSAGFSPVGVATEQRGSEAAGAADGEKAFSVQLAETTDAAEAQALLSALKRQAYFPFIDTRNGVRRVLIGRFASTEEAQRMRAQMVSEGFAFANVVDLTKIGATVGETGKTGAAQSGDGKNVPPSVKKTVEWQSLTPDQRDKVIEAVMMERASRMQLQSVEEIARLKKMVESLSEKQVSILNKITSAEQADEEQRRAISRLTMAINRAQDQRDWAGMKKLIDQLEQIDPNSPLAAMKRNRLNHLMNNTWDGQDIYRQGQEKRARELRGKATELTKSERYEDALQIWYNILGMDIQDDDLTQEATKNIEEINRILDQRREAEDKQMQKERHVLYLFVGTIAGFFILILIVVYFIGRARYNRMARQLHEEAIAPLQALREKTSALESGRGPGIAYAQDDQGLIEQAEAPDAEFMIPEAEVEEPEVEIESDTELDVPAVEAEIREAPVSIPVPGLDDAEEEAPLAPEAPAEMPMAESGEESEEDFVFSFEDSETDTQSGGQVLPEEPEGGADEEDVILSFGDADDEPSPGETTGEAVTAAEVAPPEPEKKADDDEIVFSFDDAVIEEPEEEPSSAQTMMDQKPTSEDSMYESIPLEDLNLDLGEEEPVGDKTAPMAAADVDSPLSDDSLDLDLDLPDLDAQTEDESPLAIAGVGAAGAAGAAATAATAGGQDSDNVFVQDADSQNPGDAPDGWEISDVSYASLEIVEDPDGSGGNCLKFAKSAGDGPTALPPHLPQHQRQGPHRVRHPLRREEQAPPGLLCRAGQRLPSLRPYRRPVHRPAATRAPARLHPTRALRTRHLAPRALRHRPR